MLKPYGYNSKIKARIVYHCMRGQWNNILEMLYKYGNKLASEDLAPPRNMQLLHNLSFAPNSIKCGLCIKYIVELDNVDVNEREHIGGNTPLNFACRYGKLNQVYYLLKCGAMININDIYGKSPIQNCCRSGGKDNKKIILSLLKNPPRTYKQERIDKRNILGMILNKCIAIGTGQDINQMLISIGY